MRQDGEMEENWPGKNPALWCPGQGFTEFII